MIDGSGALVPQKRDRFQFTLSQRTRSHALRGNAFFDALRQDVDISINLYTQPVGST